MIGWAGVVVWGLLWCAAGLEPFPCADYPAVARRVLPNLLYNPGMETPHWFRPEMAEFWQERPNLRRDPTVAHEGSASLRIEGPGKGYAFYQRELSLPPNCTYRLSAWIRSAPCRGKGVQLEFTPASSQSPPEWNPGSNRWALIRKTFATTTQPKQGLLRIFWDLEPGDRVWVDDVSLTPADGKLSAATAPRIAPKGGQLAGSTTVTLDAAPQAEIRYTVDGTEPTILSPLYRGPFLLMDRVFLQARAFAAGWRESPVAAVQIDLLPRATPGVPAQPIDWEEPVDRWWANHLYNPCSSRAFRQEVVSPSPRINVAEVRDRHPLTKTAGIAEALAQLPAAGGTLWFPKARGPYRITEPEKKALCYYYSQGAILIQRRSHLHFVSDGAVLEAAWPLFGFASMEYADQKTFNQPIRDFYFRGLCFDGMGKSDIACNFIHCADILFDDCVFNNYVFPRAAAEGQTARPQSWAAHPAPLVATAMTDNLWVRRSTFRGSMWGVYWDGVHNGGLVNCRFPGPYRSGPILMMTNNDMACFSPTQRNARYIVIAGCEFRAGRAAATLSNANTLLVDNDAQGVAAFMDMHGRGRSSIERGIVYEFYDNQILNNTLRDVKTLTSWNWPCASASDRSPNVVAGNRAGGLDVILANDPQRDVPLHGVVVRDNELAGVSRPQVRLRREAASLVERIEVRDNRLQGSARELVVDQTGKPLAPAGIRIRQGHEPQR